MITTEHISHFEFLITQAGSSEKSKNERRKEQDFAKFRHIEIIAKTARVFAAQNQWQEAEAKYAEVAKLMLEFDFTSSETFSRSAVKILLSKGDVYESAGKEEKAKEIFKKAERIYVRGIGTDLEIQIQKRLGDVSRIDAKAAVEYYNAALKSLRAIQSEINTSQTQIKEYYPPYILNGKLSAEFYNDTAEILEALMRLNAIEITDELKTELNDARSKAKELKAQEEKSPCE